MRNMVRNRRQIGIYEMRPTVSATRLELRPHDEAVTGTVKGQRLVVVSNRVADPRETEKAGGLAVAIADALKANNGLWFGWSGEISETAATEEAKVYCSNGIEYATVNLTNEENESYYLGHSNECIWPLFHYRADLMRFDREKYQTYLAVNRRLAFALSKLLRPGDIIWIHDYHLIPLGAELRKLNDERPIGFYLHIPFPTAPILTCMPDHDRLLRDLMAYDVVGVQTERDKRALESCLKPQHCFADGILPNHQPRKAIICNIPVGIDADEFAALSQTPDPQGMIANISGGAGNTALIIGADRLDYTKGIFERFQAYGRLLELHPECRRRVTFLQIAARSRDVILSYDEMKKQIDQVVGSIEGDYADVDWNPVCYIRRNVARKQLARLFRVSRVGLITPLRDGMNLVAKEYVAAQDPADPGVLILSKFAGASEDMTEALIVNPHDIDDIANAMHRAVNMPLEERMCRHAALIRKLRYGDAARWRHAFLEALNSCTAAVSASPPSVQPIPAHAPPVATYA